MGQLFISNVSELYGNKFSFPWQDSMTDASVTYFNLRPPCRCHYEGDQHGVSIQNSINLGEGLFRITYEWITAHIKNRCEVV